MNKIIILTFLFLGCGCEKICDKIDGKKYDRERKEWIDNKELSEPDLKEMPERE